MAPEDLYKRSKVLRDSQPIRGTNKYVLYLYLSLCTAAANPICINQFINLVLIVSPRPGSLVPGFRRRIEMGSNVLYVVYFVNLSKWINFSMLSLLLAGVVVNGCTLLLLFAVTGMVGTYCCGIRRLSERFAVIVVGEAFLVVVACCVWLYLRR